jgi:hypothetical protein
MPGNSRKRDFTGNWPVASEDVRRAGWAYFEQRLSGIRVLTFRLIIGLVAVLLMLRLGRLDFVWRLRWVRLPRRRRSGNSSRRRRTLDRYCVLWRWCGFVPLWRRCSFVPLWRRCSFVPLCRRYFRTRRSRHRGSFVALVSTVLFKDVWRLMNGRVVDDRPRSRLRR